MNTDSLGSIFSCSSPGARGRRALASASFVLAALAAPVLPAEAGGGVTPNLAERARVVAGDAAAGDRFGYRVAISGDTAVVGAPFSHPANSWRGAAYVFRRDPDGPGGWSQVAKLTASDAAPQNDFGFAVAIEGDVVLVGARANAAQQGAVYVFSRDQGGPDAWGEVKKLTASDGAIGDQFGSAVALQAGSALIGAPLDAGPAGASGSAYVFGRNAGGADQWGEVAKLTASDAAAGDLFGSSVAISGAVAIVGAPLHDGPGSASGSAYLFERDFGGFDHWGEVDEVEAADAAGGDRFGAAVALAGGTAVVGAPMDDDFAIDSGSVYVFRPDPGAPGQWVETRKLPAPEPAVSANFGWSVGAEGDRVLAGAPGKNVAGVFSGVAYLFVRDPAGVESWDLSQRLVPADLAAGDQCGLAVALSGDHLLVGSWLHAVEGQATGVAYLFVQPLFADGFESGDTSAWSAVAP